MLYTVKRAVPYAMIGSDDCVPLVTACGAHGVYVTKLSREFAIVILLPLSTTIVPVIPISGPASVIKHTCCGLFKAAESVESIIAVKHSHGEVLVSCFIVRYSDGLTQRP